MRFALLIVCLLALPAVAFSQEKPDPDEALKSLAKVLKDDRSVEQIKKDNSLIRAAGKGDLDGIRNAITSGAHVNSRYLGTDLWVDAVYNGYTALTFAVLGKRTDAVKLLIEHKADIETETPEGWTSLYLAVRDDRDDNIKIKAAIKAKHPDGRTALYAALDHDRNEIIDLLVKAGAKQDPKKIRVSLDLIDAACKGFDAGPDRRYPPYPGGPVGDTSDFPEIAAVLKQGADVNAANPQGFTALMFAANLGLEENVKTLLAHGADATLKSPGGETALSLAERETPGDGPPFRPEERQEIAKVLKQHLAALKGGGVRAGQDRH